MTAAMLGRAWKAYRTEGLAGVLWRARRLGSRPFSYDWYYLYARELGAAGEILPERYAGILKSIARAYTIDWMSREAQGDLPAYLDYRQQPRMQERQVRAWLDAGHVSALAKDGGRIVGDCWLCFGAYPLPARDGRFDERLAQNRYVLSHMAYVDPAHRGRGVFPLLLAAQAAVIHGRGARGLLGIVLERSAASKRTLEELGFECKGRLHVVGVFGKRFGRTVWPNSSR
jgi:GNAT superfamily N-acetyltransferase